eukprot:Amastigsp_a677383_84.p2 type:complete len:100 gc:universal Amastigsp_a677383_84:559-260(-)
MTRSTTRCAISGFGADAHGIGLGRGIAATFTARLRARVVHGAWPSRGLLGQRTFSSCFAALPSLQRKIWAWRDCARVSDGVSSPRSARRLSRTSLCRSP